MNSDILDARVQRFSEAIRGSASMREAVMATGLCGKTVSKYAAILGVEIKRVKREDAVSRNLSGQKQKEISALIQEIRAAAESGATREQIAEQLGIAYCSVGYYARKHQIKIKHGAAVDEDPRSEAMLSMYKTGKTLEEIGGVYGITRERVRQILSKYHGTTWEDGGKSAVAAARKHKRKIEQEVRCMTKHGCSREQYSELLKIGRKLASEGFSRERTPIGAFGQQKQSAKQRGIAWNIKLWEWWQVWQLSGKWEERGRGQYVMCRFGDTGPYEVGNVYIAHCSHNASVQPNNVNRKSHPDHERVLAERAVKRAALGETRRGLVRKPKNKDLPVGVTRSNGRFMAQICFLGKNKYLGSFGSADQAHEAYLAALNELQANVLGAA